MFTNGNQKVCDGCQAQMLPNEGFMVPGVPIRHADSKACLATVFASMSLDLPATADDAAAARAKAGAA